LAYPARCFDTLGPLCRKLLGFNVSEIMHRQAPVSVKIDPSKTACAAVPIANSVCPGYLGAVHECDLVVTDYQPLIILDHESGRKGTPT
jgi:hypothetical protein